MLSDRMRQIQPQTRSGGWKTRSLLLPWSALLIAATSSAHFAMPRGVPHIQIDIRQSIPILRFTVFA